MEKFIISFNYDGFPYKATVVPGIQNGIAFYGVQMESENQENYIEIVANPPTADRDKWDFKCPDGQEPSEIYDKQLLQEIGEAIEKYQTGNCGFDLNFKMSEVS